MRKDSKIVFADGVIILCKISNTLQKKMLELVSEFSKVEEYNIKA